MFLPKDLEKLKTLILCSMTFTENRAVCEIMWKNMIKPDRLQVTINLAYPHCLLYRHILRIRNNHCFSTATTDTRKSLNLPLYVHCLSVSCPYPCTDVTILLINPTNALIYLTSTLLHFYMFQHSRGQPQGVYIIYIILYTF